MPVSHVRSTIAMPSVDRVAAALQSSPSCSAAARALGVSFTRLSEFCDRPTLAELWSICAERGRLRNSSARGGPLIVYAVIWQDVQIWTVEGIEDESAALERALHVTRKSPLRLVRMAAQ